jgi:hypothetical protein
LDFSLRLPSLESSSFSWKRWSTLDYCFDAFSLREPGSASLDNAIGHTDRFLAARRVWMSLDGVLERDPTVYLTFREVPCEFIARFPKYLKKMVGREGLEPPTRPL